MTGSGRHWSAGPTTVRIWCRNKTDMTANFPEIASAARTMLPPHSVCDGELVSWDGDRLSFDLLQQRLAVGPARARALAADHPASYVVFDLLAADGVDLRGRRFDDRRAALEALTTWSPPMQLSPITDDFDTAKKLAGRLRRRRYRGTGREGRRNHVSRRFPRLAEIQFCRGVGVRA